MLDAARNMKLNSSKQISKKEYNSYQYRVSDVLFDVLDFLPLFPAQKSRWETNMCSSTDLDVSREIHFNAARKKRNNSRWRLYRYFRLYRNKQHRTIDIYYTRVFSLLVSESFGVILDHTASRQFQCNDFSSIWRHTGNFAFDLNINDRWTFFTVENNGFSCGFLFVLWQTCRHSCKVRLKLSCTSCIYVIRFKMTTIWSGSFLSNYIFKMFTI